MADFKGNLQEKRCSEHYVDVVPGILASSVQYAFRLRKRSGISAVSDGGVLSDTVIET